MAFTATRVFGHLSRMKSISTTPSYEAMSGYAKRIDVRCPSTRTAVARSRRRRSWHTVDVTRSKRKVSGVELILTKLHAGGNFIRHWYGLVGGFYDVEVSSVVERALQKSRILDQARRQGNITRLCLQRAERLKLAVGDDRGGRNTGTRALLARRQPA